MVALRLEFSIRKKLVSQPLRDITQLVNKVQGIQHITLKKTFKTYEKHLRKDSSFLDQEPTIEYENLEEDRLYEEQIELKSGQSFVHIIISSRN